MAKQQQKIPEAARPRGVGDLEDVQTKKLNLDRPFMYEGEVFGPGIVDVPNDRGQADSIAYKQQQLLSKGIGAIPVSPIIYNDPEKPVAHIERLRGGQENPGAKMNIDSRGGPGVQDNMAQDQTVHTQGAHPADPEGQNPGGAADPDLGLVDGEGDDVQDQLDEEAEEDADASAAEVVKESGQTQAKKLQSGVKTTTRKRK